MSNIPIAKTCLNCAKPYMARVYPNRPGLFCTTTCSTEYGRREAIRKYEENPTACRHCGTTVPYKRRNFNRIFCSGSCRATHTNQLRPKKPKVSKRELARQQETVRFERGEITTRATLRRHLLRVQDGKCASCPTTTEWEGKSLTLVVDHVDGDASNNLPANLRLLCPNCNSQTSTFGGRNKGNGRRSRGLRLS